MLRSGKNIKSSGKINIANLLAVIAICFVVAGIMFPMLNRTIEPPSDSTCFSNLNQIGKALKTYASDWDGYFPTNLTPGGTLSCEVRLSPNSKNFKTFRYGQNWVEALYPYVEKVGSPDDNDSVWKCPKVKNTTNDGNTGSSYAMNFNLVGQSEAVLKLASNTMMMIREMDRLCGAVCRPINRCTTSKTPPVGAFLTENDPIYGKCNPKLHGSGSNILFADGHLQTVQPPRMPETFTVEKNWDKKTKQWWNSLDPDHMVIKITP